MSFSTKWDEATTPRQLLDLLDVGFGRKLRHCICACLRCALPRQPDPADAHVLAFAERIADDEENVDPDEWTAVWEEMDARTRLTSSGPFHAGAWLVLAVGENPYDMADWLVDLFDDVGLGTAIPLRLFREVFGNPFRSVEFAPWRTGTAVALAAQMYESRDFSAMPILADALQDAGCDNVDVLNHCRQPGEHVRGCWVVDGVLGKE